jgi:RNA recognition motif-containing protein
MSNNELNNTVWVNKLSLDTTENNVNEYFSTYGKISKTTFCSSSSVVGSRQRSTSYCFVEFENAESAAKVLESDHDIDNVRVQVALADFKLYSRSVKRIADREKLNEKIEDSIKDMNKTDAYYYGFAQGKKYMLKNITRTPTKPRNIRYNKNVEKVEKVTEKVAENDTI